MKYAKAEIEKLNIRKINHIYEKIYTICTGKEVPSDESEYNEAILNPSKEENYEKRQKCYDKY